MIERLIAAREASLGSLYYALFVWLWRLWRTPGLVNDPILVASAVAATYAQVDAATQQARRIEQSYFIALAREMGVEYTEAERRTEALYPRNADPIDVYERTIEEFRWHAYGKQNAQPDVDYERDEDVSFADIWDNLGTDRPIPRDLAELPTHLDGDGLVIEDEETARRLDEAHARAMDRLATIVQDDLQRAGNDEQRQLMQKKRVWIGYRRVLRPELSRTGSCGLCIAAATRVYKTSELAAIHHRCRCTQMPMTVELDPGETLNREDIEDVLIQRGTDTEAPLNPDTVRFTEDMLKELYDAAGGSTYGEDLKQVRVHYFEHGELGPTMNLAQVDPQKNWSPATRQASDDLWQSTRVWAEAKRALAQAALANATGEKADSYTQAIRRFDDLIARMDENLRRTSSPTPSRA